MVVLLLKTTQTHTDTRTPQESNIDTKNCHVLRELPCPNHHFGALQPLVFGSVKPFFEGIEEAPCVLVALDPKKHTHTTKVLMAWAVGVLEVLGLIVFVGYSITYTLHVAHKHLWCFVVFFPRKNGENKQRFVNKKTWLGKKGGGFCAAGNGETLMKPYDFVGDVATG